MRHIRDLTVPAVPAACFPVLLILWPALIFAQSDADEGASYRSWSIAQLCEQRSNSDVWDEIQRRDIFDRRELATISRDRVIKGISEQALFCVMGEPDSIILALVTSNRIPFDAYLYQTDDEEWLVVHIRHVDGRSRIERVYDADQEKVEELRRQR